MNADKAGIHVPSVFIRVYRRPIISRDTAAQLR
jgi:hypothetical protein